MSAPALDDRKAHVLGLVDMLALASNSGAVLKGSSPRGRCPFCGGGGFGLVRAKGSPRLDRWRCWSACDSGGNAIDFVMKRDGSDFMTALVSLERDVGGLAGFTPERRAALARKRAVAERTAAERAERARRFALQRVVETLAAAEPLAPGQPAWRYLEDRGLDMADLQPLLRPDALAFHPACGHPDDWDGERRRFRRTWPALIARVTRPDASGALATIALQAIYVDPHAQPAPPAVRVIVEARGEGRRGRIWRPRGYEATKMATGDWRGGACRLADIPAGKPLGLAEGVEKSLAVMQLYGTACWAVMYAGNFETVALEPDAGEIACFLDNNKPLVDRRTGAVKAPAGVSAMFARRLQQTRRGVRLMRPPVGEDFSDFLVLWRAGLVDAIGRPTASRAAIEAALTVERSGVAA